MKRYFLSILIIVSGGQSWSQDSSITVNTDTAQRPIVPREVRQPVVRKDSTGVPDTSAVKDSTLLLEKVHRPTISLFKQKLDTPLYANHPFYQFTNPMRYSVTLKKWQGREAIFYSVIVLLIFFALIKNGFYRYLQDLFRTYFQTTVKQKQIKEQLLQNPLPSLLLNLFFVLSGGMFLALVLHYFQLGTEFNFWLLYLYCTLGLITIYALKFVSLKFLGWIFQLSEATESYIFIVFTTNKIIGICLLPFLALLALTYGAINKAAMSLSIVMVLGLIAYRFFLSYLSVRKQIRLSFLHFLLYLGAFEVIPLLLINKLLFRFLGETP